jgi:hypothetical protein
MGTTAGVLFALGVSHSVAVNFALASGLLLTGAALAATALGLSGSLLLTFRARRPRAGRHVLVSALEPPAGLKRTRPGRSIDRLQPGFGNR